MSGQHQFDAVVNDAQIWVVVQHLRGHRHANDEAHGLAMVGELQFAGQRAVAIGLPALQVGHPGGALGLCQRRNYFGLLSVF